LTLSVVADDNYDDLVKDMKAGTAENARDRKDTVDVLNTGAAVLLIVGGAAVGTGVVLFILAPRRSSDPTLQVGATPGSIVVSGRF
jgi:hypothetical protein